MSLLNIGGGGRGHFGLPLIGGRGEASRPETTFDINREMYPKDNAAVTGGGGEGYPWFDGGERQFFFMFC